MPGWIDVGGIASAANQWIDVLRRTIVVPRGSQPEWIDRSHDSVGK